MYKIFLRTLSAVLLLSVVTGAFARAGGGSSDVFGDGGIIVTILAFILAPFFFIYSIVASIIIWRKKSRISRVLEESSREDKIWDIRNISARVEHVYFTVQKAWSERNQEIARTCITVRLYDKHKLQTDEMIANHTRNVLERVNLKNVMVFSLSNFADNSRDTFSAKIDGSMVDYHIDVRTGDMIAGDKYSSHDFKEVWTFVRVGEEWMLDQIDQKADTQTILTGKVYKE